MPFFLGSFVASFLFTTSLFVELSTPSPAHVDSKPEKNQIIQTTILELSPTPVEEGPTLAEATTKVVYGPEPPMSTLTTTPFFHINDTPSSILSLSPIPTYKVIPQRDQPLAKVVTDTPSPKPAHTIFVEAAALPTVLTPTPTPSINSGSKSPISTAAVLNNQTHASNDTSQGTLNADLIFSLVNQHRTNMGLPAFQKDSNTCSIAAGRAPQIYDEIYVTHNMHAGLHRENYSYFINENIISMNSEQAAVSWWLNDTIHREAIEGNDTYSCVACSGHNCSEIFTSYVPR